MTYGAIAASGVVNRFERFEAPYSSMVHDFIVTENYVLFPILPLTGSMDRAMQRTSGLRLGARQGRLRRRHEARRLDQGHPLVPRRGLLRLPHHERVGGGRPHRRRRHAARGAGAVPRRRRHADRPEKQIARLARWTFNMADGSDSFTRVYLDDLQAEFPRIDDRRAGLVNAAQLVCGGHRARHAEARSTASPMSTTGPAGASSTSCRTAMPRPSRCSCRARPTAPEGDGWLLATVWRAAENRSDLAVFRATEVDRGPVATVELATRVPFGLHGNWVPAAA